MGVGRDFFFLSMDERWFHNDHVDYLNDDE